MWSVQDIRERLRALGARPKHELRVLRLWAQALPQDSGRRALDSFMPTALREALPQLSQDLAALATLREQYPAEHAACVFDAPGPTFRDEWYPQYKGHRAPMPEPLVQQIEPIHGVTHGRREKRLSFAILFG